MKHCHFSILFNELPFLKQKLPFLYKHFDQIIFFDLNIKTGSFSNDGSHEFIKNYPDPECKITLIEKADLSDVLNFKGVGFKVKHKMFAVGSSYVRDDIDVFWCTDMDEFFCRSLIPKVERKITSGLASSILVPHLIFFKNEKWLLCREGVEYQTLPWARIVAHKSGNVYGHCSIATQFPPTTTIKNEIIFHFAYVGDSRVRLKCGLYPSGRTFMDNVWKFCLEDDEKLPILSNGLIQQNHHNFPNYINIKEMIKDLEIIK